MKLVTLTRDLRPWRENDRVPVPDDVADRLVADGDATDPGVFPEGAQPPQKPTVIERITGTLKLPAGRYKTKGVR